MLKRNKKALIIIRFSILPIYLHSVRRRGDTKKSHQQDDISTTPTDDPRNYKK